MFKNTESAQEYELTINDVKVEILEDNTVLIVPNDDEFPIEVFKFNLASEASEFVNSL